MGIKRCPTCGSTKLLARKITGVQVESIENEFKINAEGKSYQIEIVGCAHCKANLNESQLVEMVQCKKCGKFTEPANLDANGECDVCRAIQERPDLANMSREDLIRMMLKLEKTVPPVPAPVTPITAVDTATHTTSTVAQEKMEAARNAMANVGDTFSKQIVKETQEEVTEIQQNVEQMQEAMNPPEEATTDDAAPKRKRGPRKKSDAATEEVTEEQVNESAETMSDLQEAPFPEQDETLKEVFAQQEVVIEPQPQAVAPQAAAPSMGFTMFDNEQSF